jgi:two-component system, LytTR family, response regulator
MLTTLIVDDEPLARRRLASLIAEVPWVTQIGEATDGATALDAIARLGPDAVFLDIQMPAMSGIEVVSRLRAMPHRPVVIFTTAHDQYAVAAFELEALDYLLKPFSHQRFMSALERARQTHARDGVDALNRAHTLLTRTGPAVLDRIFVRESNAVVPVPITEVERIEAQDDYVLVHRAQRRHLLSLRISDLEQRLPHPPFIRVHRSHIVNLDYVERIVGLDGARFEVVMKNGVLVPVSRARSQEIRRLSR